MLQVEKADRRNHWAVILAGGDGTRLKSLTRKISGDERPKQFCPVLGDVSLLEETRRRIAHEFATAQTLYVVNRRHAEYYQPLLRNVTADNLVAQPANRGTAPAILYSLLRIAVRDPNAVVTFFPSDHYISNDRMFMRHVRCASDAARRRADLIVLLGIEPETPEVEYGWIEPSVGIPGQGKVFGVRRFWEKPNEVLAQVLQLRGCLWNSFVMTASVKALLDCIERSAPELFRSFSYALPVLGTEAECRTMEYVYQHLQEVNFSQQVLAHRPEQLAVIPVTGVHWNDLGEPKRVLASLDMAGVRPHWADATVPQFA